MIPEEDKYLTIPEAAEELRVHPQTAYAWAKKGKLPSFKVNGRRLISQRDLTEWVKTQGRR